MLFALFEGIPPLSRGRKQRGECGRRGLESGTQQCSARRGGRGGWDGELESQPGSRVESESGVSRSAKQNVLAIAQNSVRPGFSRRCSQPPLDLLPAHERPPIFHWHSKGSYTCGVQGILRTRLQEHRVQTVRCAQGLLRTIALLTCLITPLY